MGSLADKTAVIFGAGGAIGSRTARVFAREGASVFLSGRNLDNVERVATQISRAGGSAAAARVDATNEAQVNAYVDDLVSSGHDIDIAFNAVGLPPQEYGQGIPATLLPYEKLLAILETHVGAQFLTSRSVGRHMARGGRGVILMLSASPARLAGGSIPSISTASAAVEGLTRSLAAELGSAGVRVLGLRPGGMADSRTIRQTFELMGGDGSNIGDAQLGRIIGESNIMGRQPTLDETAEVAAFLVSDRASSMAGTIVNASCGEVID